MTKPKQCSPEECLQRIKPALPSRRFLMSWDSSKSELWYGLGEGENAILVGSSANLARPDKTVDIVDSRLSAQTVQEFMSRCRTVDGSQLFNNCRELLRLYLSFKDERMYDLLTTWVIGTYVYMVFSHFGYLFLHSHSPRCGKTRLLEVLSHLCFEATSVLNGPTVPTIRDSAAGGQTLALDTLERWKMKGPEAYSAAMELLDAGFRNGSKVAKMIPCGDKWQKKEFPVYAPYVLAGIGKGSLADTALDRSFVIEMQRKSPSIKKKRYNFHRCEQECQPLRDEMYRWALENAARLAATYESQKLEVEVNDLELNDRAADIWKPLLAVARVLGNAEVWQALTSLGVVMGRDEETAECDSVRTIARSLRKLVNGNGAAVGMTSDFVKHLRADGVDVSEHDLHSMLTQWGFSQESVRLEQGPRRAWELQDSKLAEIET
jgi:hypothetical protein